MSRFIYYVQLALLDLWRLRQTVRPHVIVVAGICLPILLLQGMKRGHVAELRRDLLTSPTGRQVQLWSAQQGELLTRSSLDILRHELKGVDLIIPDTPHQVGLSLGAADGRPEKEIATTVFTTMPGDPLLKLVDCDCLLEGELAIVLDKDLAKELKVDVGGTIELRVRRKTTDQTAVARIKVKAVNGTAPAGRKSAYLEATVQDWIEQYLRGYYVADVNWPAADAFARDEYSGYMLFCQPDDDLRPQDHEFFSERGLKAEKVTDAQRRLLYGLLKPNSLSVYYIHSSKSHVDPSRRLTIRPKELIDFTIPDDAILPWNEPFVVQIDGKSYRFVGCSLRRDTWLWDYVIDKRWIHGDKAERLSIIIPSQPFIDSKTIFALPIELRGKATSCPLNVVSNDSRLLDKVIASVGLGTQPGGSLLLAITMGSMGNQVVPSVESEGLNTAIVPVELLAHLDANRNGTVNYDPLIKKFVPAPGELMYERARLYADTIDEVPSVVEQLRARDFAVLSESTRIREIQKQDGSLVFIVFIVSVGVLLFGIFTVGNVLQDSTARKRGTIGILRVMGVSKAGVFVLVFLRAAVIGLVAGVLTIVVGLILGWLLRFVPVSIVTWPVDLIAVFLSALACCIIGSLYPAWDASRVDPFDAIIEGKFR